MLYQIAVIVIDIGLGALALRLAKTTARQIADLAVSHANLVLRVEKVEKCLGLQA